MTQSPDDSSWTVAQGAASTADSNQIREAINALQKQAANSAGAVRMGFGCFWVIVALSILVKAGMLYIYNTVSGQPSLQQAFPYPPAVVGFSFLFMIGAVLLALYTRAIIKDLDLQTRYSIRESLRKSNLALDIVNRRVDYVRVIAGIPRVLFVFGLFGSRSETETTRNLKLLANNLSSYLDIPLNSLLANRHSSFLIAVAEVLAGVILVAVWDLAGLTGLVSIEILNYWLLLTSLTVVQAPSSQLDRIGSEELARYLRREYGLSPEE